MSGARSRPGATYGFIVSDCGFINRCGFAWSADGSSSSIADPDDFEDSYERLDADWFVWVDGF